MKRLKEYKIIIILTLFLLWIYGLLYMLTSIELNKQRKINEQLRIEYNELKKNYEEITNYVYWG